MIYLDNHATTRVDPRVVETMVQAFDVDYGNAGSTTHTFGMEAFDLIDSAANSISASINATAEEIIFTSGATESNNLAINGVCERLTTPGHIVTSAVEHKAVLDPIARLERLGFAVTRLEVGRHDSLAPGLIEIDKIADAITPETALVSIMLGNNEIGTLQDIAAIGKICAQQNVLFHTDATQAFGKIPIDVDVLKVDLMSFSAHKFYGPKGVGGLYVRQTGKRVRLNSQIVGGGQQSGLRSGTLNVPGIVGMEKALKLCQQELTSGEPERIKSLRDTLNRRLESALGELPINGLPLDDRRRIGGNLNCRFPGLSAHSLMTIADSVAVSTGSACTSATPEPSHVLTALGLSEDAIDCSLRFGIGRFTTVNEVQDAADYLISAAKQLRGFGDFSV